MLALPILIKKIKIRHFLFYHKLYSSCFLFLKNNLNFIRNNNYHDNHIFFFLNNLNFIRNGEHSNSHHNITYEIYFYFVRIKIYLSFNQIKKYGANFLKNRGKKCGANLRVLFIPHLVLFSRLIQSIEM